MKPIVLAAALVAMAPAVAFAADLPERAIKAPALAAVANWSGLYVGGNVGYGWGRGNMDAAGVIGPASDPFLVRSAFFASMDGGPLAARSKGVIGGAQIGYNWQMGSLVTGLEADFQGSAIKGSVSQSTLHPDIVVPAALDGNLRSSDTGLAWFGTVRGRLGMTVTPDLLLYGTGGLAYGRVSNSANTRIYDNNPPIPFPVDYPASVGRTKAGWALGAGAEWMFARQWSAKIEYLHVDLGRVTATGHATNDILGDFRDTSVNYTWKTQVDLVRGGVNYHF